MKGYKNTTLHIPLLTTSIYHKKLFYKPLYTFLHTYFKKLCVSKMCTKKWIQCKNECLHMSHTYLQQELDSTVYMLNLLGNSFLSVHNTKLRILYDNQPLTGIWSHDLNTFYIV